MNAAIVALEKDAEFALYSQPFVLDPHVLPEGIPWFDHVVNKFGEKEAKKEMKGQGPIAKAGKACVSVFMSNDHSNSQTK